jgi:hypothetical protein
MPSPAKSAKPPSPVQIRAAPPLFLSKIDRLSPRGGNARSSNGLRWTTSRWLRSRRAAVNHCSGLRCSWAPPRRGEVSGGAASRSAPMPPSAGSRRPQLEEPQAALRGRERHPWGRGLDHHPVVRPVGPHAVNGPSCGVALVVDDTAGRGHRHRPSRSGDLIGGAAIGLHPPDLASPAAVGRERDPGTVLRPRGPGIFSRRVRRIPACGHAAAGPRPRPAPQCWRWTSCHSTRTTSSGTSRRVHRPRGDGSGSRVPDGDRAAGRSRASVRLRDAVHQPAPERCWRCMLRARPADESHRDDTKPASDDATGTTAALCEFERTTTEVFDSG